MPAIRNFHIARFFVGVIVALISSAAIGTDPTPANGCSIGEGWVLPPDKKGNSSEAFVLHNAPAAMRLRICNCTQGAPAESYIDVNLYTQKPVGQNELPSPNLFTRLFSGSCMEAGGTQIKLINPNQKAGANGTFLPRDPPAQKSN
jgi:hypothetical protein